VAAEVLALWRTEVMHPERLSQEAADVFEQLKAAGIVYNLLAPACRTSTPGSWTRDQ